MVKRSLYIDAGHTFTWGLNQCWGETVPCRVTCSWVSYAAGCWGVSPPPSLCSVKCIFLTTKIPAEKLEFTSLMTPGANWSAVQCMPHVGIEKCHVVFVCICALEGSDIRVVSCHAVIGPSDPFICMGVGWHALCWLAAVDVLATAIGMWYRHGWVWKSFPLCFLFSLHLTAEMHVVWISQCQCPTVSNFCRHSET